jgi:hypothetical protein
MTSEKWDVEIANDQDATVLTIPGDTRNARFVTANNGVKPDPWPPPAPSVYVRVTTTLASGKKRTTVLRTVVKEAGGDLKATIGPGVFKGKVESIDFTAGRRFGFRLARVRAQGSLLNIAAVVIGIVSGLLTWLANLITNPANQGITGEKLGLTIAAAALAVVAPILVLLSNSWFKSTDVPG